MKHTLLIALLLLFSQFYCIADSPLTSTGFSSAYQDYEIVRVAGKANGRITPEIMEYLSGKRNPLDIKMAVINAVSWNINGQTNYETYLAFLEKRKRISRNSAKFYKKIHSHEILALAYLKAMDNYFEVDQAVSIAEQALKHKKKNASSYTFQIILALIKAQQAFDSDWCAVYNITDNVRTDQSLNQDMRPEAQSIIFEYMDLYKDSCQ